MFTEDTVLLSELYDKTSSKVLRDCSFSFVGKTETNLNQRIVPCGTRAHINHANNDESIVGVVTTQELSGEAADRLGVLIADNPVNSAWRIHEQLCKIDGFFWESFPTKIHPEATVHPNTVISETDVVIGKGSYIGPGTTIMPRTYIGDNCHIGVDVVVGLEAFEIFNDGENPRRILMQSGGVKIEDNVTILAKCTIVRATFGGYTHIGSGTMIDVLIHVAHDVVTEENVTLVACSEISGRCTLRKNAYVGPNAAIRNGIEIGENSKVTMGSVVTQDVEPNETVTGNFAVPHIKWLRFVKSLGKK